MWLERDCDQVKYHAQLKGKQNFPGAVSGRGTVSVGGRNVGVVRKGAKLTNPPLTVVIYPVWDFLAGPNLLQSKYLLLYIDEYAASTCGPQRAHSYSYEWHSHTLI